MIDLLLIYPRLGSMDSMVCDPPLSIIYAAAHTVRSGFTVKAIDLRVHDHWLTILKEYLDQGVMLAGISVMTGTPLANARTVAQLIRKDYPQTQIVFGGPHGTVLPETINEEFVDFLIRGYGSVPLMNLVQALKTKQLDLSAIHGLSYKHDNQPIHNPRPDQHELPDFRSLPYHLLDLMSPRYVRSYTGHRMFPIFSAIGCPYQCAFCVHPTIYRKINGAKWKPLPNDEVISHIEYVMKHFDAKHICFMDDTSFPDLKRMERLFKSIVERNFNITLEFRGARVNEIARMDHSFLDLMVEAGVRVLMVGVESGSDRILRIMNKGISRQQIIEMNLKLAKHPEITPYYNFIYGVPGETYDDLLETKNTVLQLLHDNPKAYFGFGGDWKPVPGSRMLATAVEQYPDFHPPQTYDEWIEMDSSDAQSKIVHPWYTPRHNNLIKLLQISSFVVDHKIIRETKGNNKPAFRLMRLLSRLYRPIAVFRLRHDVHFWLIEYHAWRLFTRILPKLLGNTSHD